MYGRLSGLFRPDGYTSRGIPLSQLLAMRRQGRRGDSMLAHVNPREAAMLRQMGGSGGLNPNTGLREFAPSSKTSREGGMGAKSGAGAGGVGGFGGGSTADKSGVSKSAGGGNTGAVGGSATARTGGLTGEKSIGFGSEATQTGKVGVGGTPAAGEGGVSAGDVLSGAVTGASYGSAVGPIGTGLGAILGGLYGAGAFTDNSGNVSGSGANAISKSTGPSKASSGGYSGGNAGASTGRGYDINDVLTGAAPAPIAPPPPPPSPVPNPNDPDPIVPDELLDYIEPGMTEEQIRAMIATYATNANNSYFQSPDVFDYYAGLLRPAVNTGGYGAVKPIEHQYLNQTFGLSYDPTAAALLTALGEAGLPDTPTAPPPSSGGGNVRLERAGRRRH